MNDTDTYKAMSLKENKLNLQLKPCPFCGGEAKFLHGYPRQQRNGVKSALVQCKSCGCKTPTFTQLPYQAYKDCETYVVNLWNRRINE